MRGRVSLVFVLSAAWALGTGGGGPATQALMPPPEAVGLFPYALVLREVCVVELPGRDAVLLGVQDLNGDGFGDLVVGGDRRVQVFFGNGRGSFVPGPWVYPEVEELKEDQPAPGRFVRGVWKPYELEEVGGKRYAPRVVFFNPIMGGVLVDLDGDGILDLVAVGSSGPSEQIYVFQGLGEAGFARKAALPCPEGRRYVSRLFLAGREIFFALAADLEGPFRVYRLWVPAGLEDPRLEQVLEGPWRLKGVADLTGDGRPDLLMATQEGVQVFVGEEEGFREGPRVVLAAGPVEGVTAADLDGDGLLDLVIRTPTGIVSALARPEGHKEAWAWNPGFPLWEHVVADLTGDGVPDLLVQQSMGFWEYHVLPGDGRGGFLGVAATFVVVDGDRIAKPPFVADLNADALPDLVFWPLGGGAVRVYLNGGVLPGVSLHPLPGALLGVGDLSGNGSPDVLVADVSRAGVSVLWNNGEGGLILRPLAALGRVPLAGAVVQGTAYLLLPAAERRPAELVALAPSGEALRRWRVPEETLPQLVAADLDGDGRPDLALPAKEELLVLWGGEALEAYSWPEGEVSLLASGDGRLWAVAIGEYADLVEVRFEGGAMVVSPPLLQLEALPLAMAAGDLDGDGLSDPVVLAAELDVEVKDGRPVIFPARVVAGLVPSALGPRVEEVSGFPKDHLPWPFLGAAVARIGGVPQLVFTTHAGGGVFFLPWREGLGELQRADIPGGPLLAADLDQNGEDEVLTSTVGLGTLLGILWNGGGR